MRKRFIVLKIGGSLLNYFEELKIFCKTLSKISETAKVLVVPGGGIFANTIRDLQKKIKFSDDTAHWMALLAMDTYAFLLKDMIEGSKIIYTLEETPSRDKPVILAPFNLMKEKDSLEHSWRVTSDSIAAYVAHQLGAGLLVLVKDVDGIIDTEGNVYKEIRSEELSGLGKSCVDEVLPILIKEYQVECWIVNGRYPKRLEKLVFERETFGTKIVP
ncbi:MAG: amino acid kinase [Candidatus Hodarchaeota archaeon]